MIHKFVRVNKSLYRGSAPNIEDVIMLNKKYNVSKIVSLDQKAGQHIDRACKLLGIKHIMLPIEFGKRHPLITFLKNDISELLSDEDGAVFVHCAQGKDRTSLAIALYRCEHDGWSCKRALNEAKKLGFGIGLPPKVVNLYTKIIHKTCKEDEHDVNSAYDIVSTQREYPSNYSDYSLDTWQQQSWSPYEDFRMKQYPYGPTTIDYPEQFSSRQDYDLDDRVPDDRSNRSVPQSGTSDSGVTGIGGAGVSTISGGFI
jgi:hypothetical protein